MFKNDMNSLLLVNILSIPFFNLYPSYQNQHRNTLPCGILFCRFWFIELIKPPIFGFLTLKTITVYNHILRNLMSGNFIKFLLKFQIQHNLTVFYTGNK